MVSVCCMKFIEINYLAFHFIFKTFDVCFDSDAKKNVTNFMHSCELGNFVICLHNWFSRLKKPNWTWLCHRKYVQDEKNKCCFLITSYSKLFWFKSKCHNGYYSIVLTWLCETLFFFVYLIDAFAFGEPYRRKHRVTLQCWLIICLFFFFNWRTSL